MKRSAIQPRPDHDDPQAAGRSKARSQLLQMVQRLAAEDPAQARAFLLLLRQALKPGSRQGASRALAAFGGLGSTIAEAARPTPLAVRPAQLADSWITVGRLIETSMRRFGEQHDHHAG